MADSVRVRIAPSPTGNLHLGTARTALYNYLYAKRHKGKFIMRLEDTDAERSNEAFTQDIIEGLKWLGLSWDEGPDIGGPFPPYRQTQKVDHYENVANQLITREEAYLSYETPEELNEMREEQSKRGEITRYDNRGRELPEEHIKKYEAEGRVPSIRFIIEEPRVVSWDDAIRGEMSVPTADLGGDMVIVKSSGIATYNFAVVVDDIDMKMTQVIRGEDHIINTAKQILLYEALGQEPPQFAHVSLMQDLERAKLSKRKHGEAVHIDYYRKLGYMPEALTNYLAQMSWSPPDGQEIFTLDEAAEVFDLDRVSKSAAVFDVKRLNWFNGHYIRSLPLCVVTDRALPYLQIYNVDQYSREELEHIVEAVREGLTMLSEITEKVQFAFTTLVTIAPDVKQSVLGNGSASKVLSKSLEAIGTFPFGDHKGCKKIVDDIGKELSVKGKDLYWPLRAALAGSTQGPDLGSMISILGQSRVKARLEAAINLCH